MNQELQPVDSILAERKTRIKRIVKNMTLFDDNLMSLVFENNIEATNHLLRTILGRNVQVESCIGQKNLQSPNPDGHNIILDIQAIDVNGHHFNVEVQNGSKGADVHRARYHSSMMDTRMLNEGEDYSDMKDSYVIFIYKHDKFRKGLPLYHVERQVLETGNSFGDGSHIIYVNGQYKGNDAIGRLIQDFHCKNAADISNAQLADAVRYHKEQEEDANNMCKAVEDFAKEVAEEYAQKVREEMESRAETEKARAESEKARADALEAELAKYKAMVEQQEQNK
jgi:predicted transposase/invertase (TIGR01784 family)